MMFYGLMFTKGGMEIKGSWTAKREKGRGRGGVVVTGVAYGECGYYVWMNEWEGLYGSTCHDATHCNTLQHTATHCGT